MASSFTEELAKRLREAAKENAKIAHAQPTNQDTAIMMNAMLDGIIVYVDLIAEMRKEANVGKN